MVAVLTRSPLNLAGAAPFFSEKCAGICVFEKNLQCPSHGGHLHRHFLVVTREQRAVDQVLTKRPLSHHEPPLPVRTASRSGSCITVHPRPGGRRRARL